MRGENLGREDMGVDLGKIIFEIRKFPYFLDVAIICIIRKTE